MAPPRIGSSPTPVVSTAAPANAAAPSADAPTPLVPGSDVPQQIHDYFGDNGNNLVPKNGYLDIKVGGSGVATFPEKIKLADGRTANVTKKSAEGSPYYEIKAGKDTLYAVPLGAGIYQFYRPEPQGTGKNGDVFFGDRMATPVSQQNPLAQVFTEAARVASGSIAPHLDPQTIQANYDKKIDAAMGPTRKQVQQLAAASKGLMMETVKSQKELDEAIEPLMPAIEKGEIKVSRDDQGKFHLELQQTPGMSDGEHAKLSKRFSGAMSLAEMKLDDVQNKMQASVGARNANADALYSSLNRPEMQKYFASLPPDKRIAEFNQYAGALAGTPAGQRLADDMFNTNNSHWKSVDPGGVLKPRPGTIASTVLQGAYDSPASKTAMQGLVLSMAPHLKDNYGVNNPAELKVRMFELTFGRKLSGPETEMAKKFAAVTGPADLAKLVEGGEGAPGAESRKGVAAEMLAQLGETAHIHGDDAIAKAQNGLLKAAGLKNPLEKLAPAVKAGASFLATYSAYESLGNVMREGANLENMTELAENTTRTVGTWAEVGSMVSDADWLEKTGKVAGVTASALGAVVDTIKAVKAESPEAQEHHTMQALASAGVVVASVADAPMVAVGFLAYKLFSSKGPSESYDHAYGDLKRVEQHVVP